MNVRFASRLAFLLIVGLIVPAGLALGAAPSPPPEAVPVAADGAPVSLSRFVPDDGRRQPVGPAQGCTFGGITRLLPGELDFELQTFPSANTKWRLFDAFASLPGQNDVLTWGRADCEASVGGASAWSVGGGRRGSTLSCEQKEYPTDLGRGIRAGLRYVTFDFSTVPNGMRVTFDYKAKMPDQALFVGVADFDKRDDQGRIGYIGYRDFIADTGGEWVRGRIVELDQATGIKNASLLFEYDDPPTAGAGLPSQGVYGVFIDNVHVDAKFSARPCPVPSPSATLPPPTVTSTPTRTPSATPIRPTRTTPSATIDTRLHDVFMPLAMKSFSVYTENTPMPTAPTPTRTPIRPTSTPVPTDTPEPSATPYPTDTPLPTDVPTRTPEPYADVRIVYVQPLTIDTIRLDLEIVRLRNQGTLAQLMDGWRVYEVSSGRTGSSPHTCMIPNGVTIEPGAYYEVRSGRDATNGIRVDDILGPIPGFVCDKGFIWDNHIDEAQLWNKDNERVDTWCYDEFGQYPCPNP